MYFKFHNVFRQLTTDKDGYSAAITNFNDFVAGALDTGGTPLKRPAAAIKDNTPEEDDQTDEDDRPLKVMKAMKGTPGGGADNGGSLYKDLATTNRKCGAIVAKLLKIKETMTVTKTDSDDDD